MPYGHMDYKDVQRVVDDLVAKYKALQLSDAQYSMMMNQGTLKGHLKKFEELNDDFKRQLNKCQENVLSSSMLPTVFDMFSEYVALAKQGPLNGRPF